jgi:photoactive yellow protein
MSIERIELGPEAILAEVGSLTPQELDLLPFGAIRLSTDGTITAYNQTEEKLANRKAEDVVGKNFFSEVAPCTRVKRFYGAFQAGVERKELSEVFDFIFAFPTGARDVRIRMIYTAAPKPAVWIFVTPL